MVRRTSFTICALLANCLACSWAVAGQFAKAEVNLRTVRDPAGVRAFVKENPALARDLDIASVLRTYDAGPGGATQRVRAIIAMKALAERITPDSAVNKQVTQIKSPTLYRDPGIKEDVNWLGRALDRLGNLHLPTTEPQSSNSQGGLGFSAGQLFVYLIWALLGVAALLLLVFGVLHIRLRKGSRRASRGVLDESEVLLTLDQWLAEADALAAGGKFREAVRALYVAALLRFDEARVARFDRGQTNWEHFHRIEASSTLPPEIDFRSATRLFDLVWYGMQTRGLEDVAEMREAYTRVAQSLQAREPT